MSKTTSAVDISSSSSISLQVKRDVAYSMPWKTYRSRATTAARSLSRARPTARNAERGRGGQGGSSGWRFASSWFSSWPSWGWWRRSSGSTRSRNRALHRAASLPHRLCPSGPAPSAPDGATSPWMGKKGLAAVDRPAFDFVLIQSLVQVQALEHELDDRRAHLRPVRQPQPLERRGQLGHVADGAGVGAGCDPLPDLEHVAVLEARHDPLEL